MTDDTTGQPTEQDLVDFARELAATEGSIEPDPVPGELSPAHADYLAAQAIDVELARALGVRTLAGPADLAELGDAWERWANFPAILFPWTSPTGRVEYQARPDNPTTDRNGRPRKYVFRRGMVPVLWQVRFSPAGVGQSRVLIVEGTKQALAAASHSPAGWHVYGIAGCRMWQVEGVPIADLQVADGRDVVVVLDADATSNPDVYAAGTGLADALASEGASSVKFARLPGGGKAGLDDVLAMRPADRRAGYLARLIDGAKAKPADKAPRPRKKQPAAPGDSNRVTLVCNRDRFEVINDLTAALVTRWDGRELFNHGGVISRLRGSGMVPVDRGVSRDLIQETAVTVNEVETAQGTTYDYTWPDPNTIQATLSRADKFSPLERVAHAPFVRPDGTIVTEPGYDEPTRTVLVPDPEMAEIEVPEQPSPEQVAAARELLLTEWLGDFPFDGPADRANALALVVTPAVRGLLPRVPLAVVDGLQMGVGKNLLADSILTVYTGEPARPMNFVDEREELRKQITSAFRTGAEFFVFDEAHTIDGAALAQALTASTWQDRILGVSTMAEFPNRVTWMSLGNQVQVRGDLTRRVYRIALRPTYADPQDRPASSFRHPGQSGLDLGSWTRRHRRDLLRAVLVLVRAWFAAGQPYPARAVSFGSFETWERTVGGIVATAGLEGFLGNLTVWRSESDFDTQYWAGHLAWLVEQFGEESFRTADVKTKALTDPAGYLAPPRLDDPTERGYTKSLGEAYSRLRGRRYGGTWIEKLRNVTGHVSLWRVVTDGGGTDTGGEDLPRTDEGTEGTKGSGSTYAHARDVSVGGSGGTTGGDPVDEATGKNETEIPAGSAFPGSPQSPALDEPQTGEVDSLGTSGYLGAHDRQDDPGPARADRGPGGAGPAGRDRDAGGPATGLVLGGDPVRAVRDDRAGGRPGTGSSGGAGDGAAPDGQAAEEDRPAGPGDQRVDGVSLNLGDPSSLATAVLEPLRAGLVTFDLETGDAGDLYRYPDPQAYIRIAGWSYGDSDDVAVEATPVGDVAASITTSAVVTGHNVMAFDLPALVRAGRITMREVHDLARAGRVFDTLLAARHLDPPMARDKGVDAQRRHDLDSLGERLGLGRKTDSAKRLAKAHGGYDKIPLDDPEYLGYLVGDVQLSQRLYRHLMSEFDGEVPAYLAREHRVAALAAQISHNGFRVDTEELKDRVAAINQRKAESYQFLNLRHGIPLADAKGKPYKAPLGTNAGKAALEAALREAGATSIWRTEKTGQLDISGEHMLHLSQEYQTCPGVREIAKHVYRIVSARSVYETVAANLCPDGRVHPRVAFRQATGRWSLTEPGLTVMGKRGGRHVEREIFLPEPGELVLTVDLSQVDMRGVAGLSQDLAYIAMLEAEDPHAEIAEALFGDRRLRERAKAIGHGWNYGRGIKAISESEEIDPGLVRRFDASMRERFPRLVEWQDEVRAIAESGRLLDNGFGRPMRPDPHRAHTQGPALMGQGAARDIMMEGLLRLADRRPEVLPMLRAQIHDEVVLSVPADQFEDVRRAVVEAFTWTWRGVPILADFGPAGKTWGHCYAKD